MPPTRRKSVTAKDDGEGLYEVKAIVDKRIIQDDVVQYRVQWKDKKFQGRDTWETRENLVDGCEIMLSKFEERLQKRREKLTKRQIAQQLKKDHLKTKKRQREQSVTAVPVENSSLSDTRARKRRAAKKVIVKDTDGPRKINKEAAKTTKSDLCGDKKPSIPEPPEPQIFCREVPPGPQIFRCESCKFYADNQATFEQHLRGTAHAAKSAIGKMRCSGCRFHSSNTEKIMAHVTKHKFHYEAGKDLHYLFFEIALD